jgi:GAF domain-containing protein
VDANRQAAPDGSAPFDLAAAYAELTSLVLDGPDVTDFLRRLAVLAGAIVPGAHCGITLRRDGRVASVAGSDAGAMRMDEIQYLRGRGPCLEALRTSERVDVPDMAEEQRWGDYSDHALANGVGSALSLPLVVDGGTIGALNLFAPTRLAFDEAVVTKAQALTDQAGTTLTLLFRQARTMALGDQLREALATRAAIDQALGILMYARKIGASEAFELLRHASQTSNRKVSAVAADIIENMTGHPLEPPRPLATRD